MPDLPPATDRSFATYLDAHERDQLDARAATAEQERDEALEARDVLRHRTEKAERERDSLARRLALRFEETEKLRAGLAAAQRTIAAQAAQIRANGTLLARLHDLAEQADRAWAEHDTAAPGSPADRAQDDRPGCPACSGPVRETVGMVCRTCGIDYAPAGRAQDGRTGPGEGERTQEAADAHLGEPAGYEIVATRLHWGERGELVSGDVVASAVSDRPKLWEALDELRSILGPAERAEG